MADWNDTFTGPVLTGPDVYPILEMMILAIEERQRGQVANVDFDIGDVRDDGFWGWLAFQDTYEYSFVLELIREIQGRVLDLGALSVRRYNGDGSEYNPVGDIWMDSNVYEADWTGDYGDSPVSTPLLFPYPNGWRRKFRREIYTLSYPGVDGQRARFVSWGFGTLGTNEWYMTLHDDPSFGTLVITPEAEREHGGKYFDRVSGAWVLSADQLTPADEVDETISAEFCAAWVPAPGDIFGVWILNDLRDAINQCSRYAAGSDVDFAGYGVEQKAGGGGPYTLALFESELKVGSSDVDLATAQADYDAAAVQNPAPFGTGVDEYVPGIYTFGNSSLPFYEAKAGRLKTVMADVSLSTLTVKVKTLLTTPSGPYASDEDYGLTYVTFDNVWRQIGTEATQDIDDPSEWFGSIPATSPTPWAVDSPITAGWVGGWMAMIYDGVVSGGFAFSELT